MSFREQVSSSLTVLVESCRAATNALTDSKNVASVDAVPPFATLRADFLSILSLIHSATTKSALVLKPSAPQYKAALEPLRDLSERVAALVHSILLMRNHQSSAMLKEYENIARNVLDAVLSFGQTLRSLESTSNSEDYLVRAGGIHNLIDDAKKPGALSIDNWEAVRKRWNLDHLSIQDAAEELNEICNPGDAKDEDDLDDGWDELGLGPSASLTAEEKARAEAVQAVVKIAVLLHKRVIKDVLTSKTFPFKPSQLDSLCTISADWLAASDDLISSAHPPQSPDDLRTYLEALSALLKRLQVILFGADTLESKMASASLADERPEVQKSRKWFSICFEQLSKAQEKAISSLNT